MVAVDNNEDKITKLREAAQHQDRLVVLRADLSDLDELRTRLTKVVPSTHGFDIVINNAAIYPSKPFEQYSIAEHQAVQRINVDTAIVAVQVALPGMRAKSWGRIINGASITMYGGGAPVPSLLHCSILAGLQTLYASSLREQTPPRLSHA